MNKKLKNTLSILLPILLGAFLVIYEYKKFTPEELNHVLDIVKNADITFILLSALMAFLGYVFRAYRWRYTLEYIGYKSDFKFNLTVISIAYFLNLTIPRSGEISRAALLAKYKGVPFDKGFGTIIAERIVDFFILMSFVLLAVVIEFSTLKEFLLKYIPVQTLVTILIVGFLFGILGLYLLIYSKNAFILKIKSKISGLTEGVLSVFKMPNKWAFFLQTLAIWTSYVLMFYFVIFALEETRMISFGTVLVAFVIGSLTIAFTNGGFGFFQKLIAEILVLYSIPFASGYAFGWVSWTSQLIITVFLGGLAFLILPTFNKKEIN